MIGFLGIVKIEGTLLFQLSTNSENITHNTSLSCILNKKENKMALLNFQNLISYPNKLYRV